MATRASGVTAMTTAPRMRAATATTTPGSTTTTTTTTTAAAAAAAAENSVRGRYQAEPESTATANFHSCKYANTNISSASVRTFT